MYFRGSNDILIILSVGIQWEDLWNSYLKKLFEIHGFWPLKSWIDFTQIQILMILNYSNKKFRFGPSNPNPWAQIHPSKQTICDPFKEKIKQSQLNKSNARDTTNFTTKCLQTDMTSYMDITHKQLKHQITNSILTFNINKSLIVDVLLPYRMPCQFISI